MIIINNISDLVELSVKQNKKISDIMIEQQMEEQQVTKEDLMKRMEEVMQVMYQSSVSGCQKDIESNSGLTKADAYKMKEFAGSEKTLFGPLVGSAITKALAVSGYNAAMKKVVAAPTAGSSGIIPACIISLMEERKITKENAIKSLFCASGIGIVIEKKATLAGSQGGCQAECGSASAMAAAAIVELCGGTPQMCSDASAIALKNVLGLVCDPVAGLVEVPCIKRNVLGTVNAFAAAQMALAGIESKIPADEVIIAMKQIGDNMPSCLKETALGGLAITPTAKEIENRIFGNQK